MVESLDNGDTPNLHRVTMVQENPAESGHSTRLTSAEIGNLWSQYLWDSMAVLFLQHFARNVIDAEISTAVLYALELSQKHTGRIKEFFITGGIPIPVGFTDNDVNPNAPQLFSDSLYLHYLSYMAKNGMTVHTQALAMSTRTDIRSFYSECLDSSRELDNKTTGILLSKGLHVRPPYIPLPKEVDFVEKKSFLGSIFGSDRVLHAMEISHLFFNIQRNALGKAVLTGFSQVVQSQEIRDYFIKGIEIAHKHIEIFSYLLEKDDLPAIILDTEVMNSNASPFSDKIMLYHTTFIDAVSTGFYGFAMGASSRNDITVSYARLMAEALKYGGEGANIMINNGWMEEPPQADEGDRPNKELH